MVIGEILAVIILLLIGYAVYCSTQCDCVDLHDWNEDFVALSEEERSALARAKV